MDGYAAQPLGREKMKLIGPHRKSTAGRFFKWNSSTFPGPRVFTRVQELLLDYIPA